MDPLDPARSAARVRSVTGIVLAGGQGRRMGGVDKGLVDLDGKPMVQHVIERFAPQVDALFVNANQNADRYAALGYAVIGDAFTGFAGPLAGLHAGMAAADSPLVATASGGELETIKAELAVARTFEQPHPVFCLAQRALRPHLEAFLQGGGRKIDAWYATLRMVEVAFDDEADAFRNINTRDELKAASPR